MNLIRRKPRLSIINYHKTTCQYPKYQPATDILNSLGLGVKVSFAILEFIDLWFFLYCISRLHTKVASPFLPNSFPGFKSILLMITDTNQDLSLPIMLTLKILEYLNRTILLEPSIISSPVAGFLPRQ